jgi:APA family basic amino acid/polyamine antiporter
MQKGGTLARKVGLGALILYGIGDMVGAGIYGTIGKISGELGNAVWIAFVIAMVAALLTGLSYASLASRYPRAAGAAYVAQRAYGRPFIAYLVGMAVAASGLTSMATASHAFTNALRPTLGGFPPAAVILLFLGMIALVNFLGIRHSIWANGICTLIEVAGLLFVIVTGARFLGSVNYLESAHPEIALPPGMLLSGAVLAFFAFIGFEDMLNVAEEVKEPERTMPRAMVIALVSAAILYVTIALTAVSVVPFRELADARLGAPFVQITARSAPWLPGWVFQGITLFAVANTALINFIMASRLTYGLARQGLLPAPLGVVHPRRQTPHLAIFVIGALVLALALSADLTQLATATSLLLLVSFCVVNTALVILKLRPAEPAGRFEIPIAIPALGTLVCAGLIAARIPTGGKAPMIALAILAGIAALYLVVRPRNPVPAPDTAD